MPLSHVTASSTDDLDLPGVETGSIAEWRNLVVPGLSDDVASAGSGVVGSNVGGLPLRNRSFGLGAAFGGPVGGRSVRASVPNLATYREDDKVPSRWSTSVSETHRNRSGAMRTGTPLSLGNEMAGSRPGSARGDTTPGASTPAGSGRAKSAEGDVTPRASASVVSRHSTRNGETGERTGSVHAGVFPGWPAGVHSSGSLPARGPARGDRTPVPLLRRNTPSNLSRATTLNVQRCAPVYEEMTEPDADESASQIGRSTASRSSRNTSRSSMRSGTSATSLSQSSVERVAKRVVELQATLSPSVVRVSPPVASGAETSRASHRKKKPSQELKGMPKIVHGIGFFGSRVQYRTASNGDRIYELRR